MDQIPKDFDTFIITACFIVFLQPLISLSNFVLPITSMTIGNLDLTQFATSFTAKTTFVKVGNGSNS